MNGHQEQAACEAVGNSATFLLAFAPSAPWRSPAWLGGSTPNPGVLAGTQRARAEPTCRVLTHLQGPDPPAGSLRGRLLPRRPGAPSVREGGRSSALRPRQAPTLYRAQGDSDLQTQGVPGRPARKAHSSQKQLGEKLHTPW